jgi:hypothetical protein
MGLDLESGGDHYFADISCWRVGGTNGVFDMLTSAVI